MWKCDNFAAAAQQIFGNNTAQCCHFGTVVLVLLFLCRTTGTQSLDAYLVTERPQRTSACDFALTIYLYV